MLVTCHVEPLVKVNRPWAVAPVTKKNHILISQKRRIEQTTRISTRGVFSSVSTNDRVIVSVEESKVEIEISELFPDQSSPDGDALSSCKFLEKFVVVFGFDHRKSLSSRDASTHYITILFRTKLVLSWVFQNYKLVQSCMTG